MVDRQVIVDAYYAYAILHDTEGETLSARFSRNEALRDLVSVPSRARGRSRRSDGHWDYIADLDDDTREAYFALCQRFSHGTSTEPGDWERIHDVGGVTIHVENSDDDPTRVNFHIQDDIADAWADVHGSLDGGTWECADGPDFVYDLTYWHPGLIEGLLAEGYDLDLSTYSEPGERDIEVAKHAAECDACQWDHSKGVEHLDAIEAGAESFPPCSKVIVVSLHHISDVPSWGDRGIPQVPFETYVSSYYGDGRYSVRIPDKGYCTLPREALSKVTT